MKRRAFAFFALIGAFVLLTGGAMDRFSGIELTSDNYVYMPEISAPSGDPPSNRGWLYVKDNSGTTDIYFEDDAGSVTELTASASGAANLDEAYNGGTSITVDGTAVTLNMSHATNDGLELSKSTGTGDVLQITNAGTGNDINGTSGTWYISKLGAGVFSSITTTVLDLSGTSLPGASPLILEGGTANDYETTVAVTDPTADRTVTLADASGTVMLSSLATNAADAANAVTGTSNGLLFEGATADAHETTLSPTDPTADRAITLPNAAGEVLLSTAVQDAANSVKGIANGFEFEGSSADTNEIQVVAADAAADVTVTIPAGTGAVMLSALTTNAPDVANSVTGTTNGVIWEGATANAHETTITATDATADRSVVLPDAGGTIMLSSLSTNGADAANSVTGASNGMVWEGATADGFETTVSATDPTADRTVTLPDAGGTVMLSSLATNGVDAANAVTGASNGLVFEGATADAHETTIAPTDATADRTLTLPNASGVVQLTTKTVTDDADGMIAGDFTAAMKGHVITNAGAVGGAVFALPAATAGDVYTFVVAAAQNMDINPDDADQILGLTNAAGDAVRNATIGGSVTLLAIDATNWVVIGSYGTWSDVN